MKTVTKKGKSSLPVILAVGAVVLVAAMLDRFDVLGGSAVAMPSQPQVASGSDALPVAPVVRPVRTKISESIETLAEKIVAQSPNQQEAYAFLVEAKSLRIQELKTRRAQLKAEDQKATYEAELWSRKMEGIDNELQLPVEKDSVTTQAQQSRAVFSDVTEPTKKGIDLAGFGLRAIFKDDNDYKANLYYQKQYYPAKKGYVLFGKVKVADVTADSVTLSMDGETTTLYAR